MCPLCPSVIPQWCCQTILQGACAYSVLCRTSPFEVLSKARSYLVALSAFGFASHMLWEQHLPGNSLFKKYRDIYFRSARHLRARWLWIKFLISLNLSFSTVQKGVWRAALRVLSSNHFSTSARSPEVPCSLPEQWQNKWTEGYT